MWQPSAISTTSQTRCADLAQLRTRLVLWFVGTAVAVVGATGILRFA